MMIQIYICDIHFAAVVTCPVPLDGSFTKPVNSNIPTNYGDTYTYQCIEGRRSADNMTVKCMIDGSWSDSAPICSSNIKKNIYNKINY